MGRFLMGFLVIAAAVVLGSGSRAFADDGDIQAMQKCFKNWGKHPFDAGHPDYRTVATKVRVLGIGGDVVDDAVSSGPELILVKPNVSVLSKTEIKLLNPNGWYCLKTNVAVLGKSEIMLHCNAKLASTSGGATVLGASDRDGSVSVLGSTRVARVGCEQVN